jgi:hypothetical protein
MWDEEGQKFNKRTGQIGLPFKETMFPDKDIDTLYSFIAVQAQFIDKHKDIPEDLEYAKSHLVVLALPHPRVTAGTGRKWLSKCWKNASRTM